MIYFLVIFGMFLLIFGTLGAFATTIIMAIMKKKKVWISAICIPLCLAVSLTMIATGGYMYGQTDEYKEDMTRRKIEDAKKTEEITTQEEERKRLEDEIKITEEVKAPEEVIVPEEQEEKERIEKENGKKEEISDTNPVTLYYMELYENYEDYLGKYVTISAPLSYVNKETVNIKGEIEGITGMITITLLEINRDLSEGDFVTVTGRIDNKALGYLYMKDANILEVGDNPREIYNQQKEEYDELFAQKSKKDENTSDINNDNANTGNAYHVGDAIETKKVKLSYLSCGEYSDKNMFVQPSEGNKFVYFEFEFENIGDTDTSVGYFDFDCYADGYECKSVLATADNAMTSIASISPRRKLNGIVVFEVSKTAESIEVEYETSYWTQKKAIFVYE